MLMALRDLIKILINQDISFTLLKIKSNDESRQIKSQSRYKDFITFFNQVLLLHSFLGHKHFLNFLLLFCYLQFCLGKFCCISKQKNIYALCRNTIKMLISEDVVNKYCHKFIKSTCRQLRGILITFTFVNDVFFS